jgi:hypothetical protein
VSFRQYCVTCARRYRVIGPGYSSERDKPDSTMKIGDGHERNGRAGIYWAMLQNSKRFGVTL